MKWISTLNLAVAALGLTAMLGGCGSSDSGSSDTPGSSSSAGMSSSSVAASSSSAGMTSENVGEFASMISDEIGCEYTGSQAAVSRGEMGIVSINGAVKLMMANASDRAKEAKARETETLYGECGGSATMTASANGETITMNFTDYCSSDYGGITTTLSGSVVLTATQSGENITLNASTPTPLNLVTDNPNTSETVNVTVDLQNGSMTMNSDGSMNISVSSVKIDDNVGGNVYQASNIQAEMSADGSATISAVYTDPELGTINVSGSFDANGQGSLTMVGADGSNSTISTTATEGVFIVTTNGETTGTMDCSSVDTSILDSLI